MKVFDLSIREQADGDWYWSLRKPCGEVLEEREGLSDAEECLQEGVEEAYEAAFGGVHCSFTLNVTIEKE